MIRRLAIALAAIAATSGLVGFCGCSRTFEMGPGSVRLVFVHDQRYLLAPDENESPAMQPQQATQAELWGALPSYDDWVRASRPISDFASELPDARKSGLKLIVILPMGELWPDSVRQLEQAAGAAGYIPVHATMPTPLLWKTIPPEASRARTQIPLSRVRADELAAAMRAVLGKEFASVEITSDTAANTLVIEGPAAEIEQVERRLVREIEPATSPR
jgi:hypothetical protein